MRMNVFYFWVYCVVFEGVGELRLWFCIWFLCICCVLFSDFLLVEILIGFGDLMSMIMELFFL